MPRWSLADLPARYRAQARRQLIESSRLQPVGDDGEIDLTLPLDLPSRNQIDVMHWSARHRLRQEFEDALSLAGVCFEANTRQGRWLLTITRLLGRRQRVFDDDNAVGGAKQLIDALVRCGWFVDDGPDFLVVRVAQDAGDRAAGPAVRLQVERAPA